MLDGHFLKLRQRLGGDGRQRPGRLQLRANLRLGRELRSFHTTAAHDVGKEERTPARVAHEEVFALIDGADRRQTDQPRIGRGLQPDCGSDRNPDSGVRTGPEPDHDNFGGPAPR